MTARNIRFIDDEIWLECGKTKNGDPHMVMLHPEAEWAAQHIPFTAPYDWYYEQFRRAAKEIGRPELWVHDLRRSFASGLLSSGGTLDDVQVALNQKSRAAAERYAHMDLSRKKAIFGRKIPSTISQPRELKPKKSA